MGSKTDPKVYNSMEQWRENLFPQMEKEKKLAELKKDAGQLGIKLANDSFDKLTEKSSQS